MMPAMDVLNNNNNNNINDLVLQVKRLSEDAILPVRGSEWAAGYDLSASKAISIPPGGRVIVPTDLSISCPAGTYGRVAPRSGLTVKFGIHVGAGVIDADYRGPVGVVLFNLGTEPFDVAKGDRIAQLILEKIVLVPVMEVQELDETVRGSGGFGSTGMNTITADASSSSPEDDDDGSSNKKARTTTTTISPVSSSSFDDAATPGGGDDDDGTTMDTTTTK